jgi:RimJ/RimL family protein N-acetyltransferase
MTVSGFHIREAVPTDAPALLELKLALDEETRLMLLEPGERQETAADVAAQLRQTAARPNATVLVAEREGALLGYVEAQGGSYRRNRHRAEVVIGVRRAAAGRGIGSALLHELSAWAERQRVHRLELTVMADNERAIALYRRCGYESEGMRRHSIRRAGAYVDELEMAKLHD